MPNMQPPATKEEAVKMMADAVANLTAEDAKYSRDAWDILRSLPYEDGYAMFVVSADEASRDGAEEGFRLGYAAGVALPDAAVAIIEAARDWADGRTVDDCKPGSELALHNAVTTFDYPEPPA